MMVFYDDIVCVIAKVYTVKIYAYNEPINFYSVPLARVYTSYAHISLKWVPTIVYC